MKKIIVAYILTLIMINLSFSTPSPKSINSIFDLMAQRAALMKDVAANKWIRDHNVSAYTADQEIKVLKNGELIAENNNLNVSSLLVFIQVQMDLSKHIENYWFINWNKSTTPKADLPNKKSILSLDKLRDNISKIDNELFTVIAQNLTLFHQDSATLLTEKAKLAFENKNDALIKGIPVNPNFINLLVNSLQNIKYEDKPLKVCTPGDYPPLTSYDPQTEEYSGFDIKLIKSFADKNSYKINFIKTTWASLSHDLKDKCDIAVGGITKTPQRIKLFYTSNKVLNDYKGPIFSRHNDNKFKSYSDINQNGVILIENKGGTNESFAQSHITNAKLQILPTNESVYACLNKYPNKLFVMLTDTIEIKWRATITNSILSDKGLSYEIPNNPETQKVFLTNKNQTCKDLKDQLNQFLKENKKIILQLYDEAIREKYHLPEEECPI